MEEAFVQITVQGLVQGVGFRWYVAQIASELKIRGYVSNLYSGEVRIEAQGSRIDLEELIRRVRIGPRASRVTALHVEWNSLSQDNQRFTHFEIR